MRSRPYLSAIFASGGQLRVEGCELVAGSGGKGGAGGAGGQGGMGGKGGQQPRAQGIGHGGVQCVFFAHDGVHTVIVLRR